MSDAAVRLPAETFPPGQFIREEIAARGLTDAGFELLLRDTGSNQFQIAACCLITYVEDKKLILDPDTAACLGRAFDVSPEFFLNLDRAWRGVKR